MRNKKLAQIVAIIGLIIIACMVIATFVVGCMDFEGHDRVFFVLIFSDIIVPVVMYFFLWVMKRDRREIEKIVEAANETEEEDASVEEEDK